LARKGKYEVKTTDINDLVTKTSSMFSRTRKELKIITDLNVVKPVDVDRGQIEQVLLNLFLNAWQAMSGGGVLRVETDNQVLVETDAAHHRIAPGDYVKISVTDNGIGMDSDLQKKVFDPFFTTKAMSRGTGLGLSSAYGIIKNHSGFITINSQPEEGTTFDVFLPASLKNISVEKKPIAGVLYGNETILLIDDETMILEVGTEILEMMGYNVLSANCWKKAEKIFKEKKDEISLVIIDMIMPEESGSMIYDYLKKIDSEVKALLSSGYSYNEQAAEIINKGCNGFIQKPFSIDVLSRKIRDIIGG
jgi:two-component system, cell cycle sensor histidine kinase and response regulator CckA